MATFNKFAKGVMSLRIPFQRPTLPSLEAVSRYFAASEEARFYSNGGPCSRLLEDRLSDYLGVEHVCAGANATLSLMVACRAAFGRRGGTVLTPSFTFAATATAIEWAGFRPHFVDTDPTTFQMCPVSLKNALTHGPTDIVGILACGSFGIPASADDSWRMTADEHGVPVVFDSAAALGSTRESGDLAGNRGRCEVFSMHATKPFAVGEGSVLTTNDAELASRVRQLQNFGFSANRTVDHESGINAKLSELSAAVALAVLDGFPSVLAQRAAALQSIKKAFESVAQLPFPVVAGSERSALQFVPLRIREDRDEVVRQLDVAGVETRLYYHPLHTMNAFAACGAEHQDGTNSVWSQIIALPMANDLSESECHHLGTALATALRR